MLPRSIRAVGTLLLSLLMLLSTALSLPAAAVEGVTVTPTDVSVSVTSDDDRFVLPGIAITLFEWDGSSWVDSGQEVPVTDDEGTSSFQVTSPGDYLLGFVDPREEFVSGFGTGSAVKPAGPGQPGTFEITGTGTEPIVLEAGLEPVVDPETEDAEVVGLVVDEEGEPIPFVAVSAVKADKPDVVVDTDTTSEFSQFGNHEPRGGYRLLLPPGDYLILFEQEDDETTYRYGGDIPTIISVKAGRHYKLDDFEIPAVPEVPTRSLTGKIVDNDDRPLVDAYVDLYRVRPNNNFTHVDYSSTDAEGTFNFDEVPIGKPLVACFYTDFGFQVCNGKRGIEEAEPFTIPEGSDGYTLPEPLRDPTVEVSFSVEDVQGRPMSDVFVYLVADGVESGYEYSRSDGSVTLPSVFPGQYAVCTHSVGAEYCSGPADGVAVRGREDAVPFTVPGGSGTFTAPDLRLPIGGLVSGVVQDVTGGPVAGLSVYIMQQREPNTYHYIDGALTSADGSFSLRRLEPGRYAVCATLPGSGGQCFGATEEDSLGTFDVVESAGDIDLEEPLVTPKPVLLEGRVVGPEGGGLPSTNVDLFTKPAVGQSQEPRDYQTYIGYGRTADDGSYSIPVFPGGAPITVCSYLGADEVCLGGVSSLADAMYVTVDGSTSPLLVSDLAPSPGSISSDCDWVYDDGFVLDNGTIAMGLGCAGNAIAFDGETENHDAVGLRLGDLPDTLTQGCWCEGWGVADAVTGERGLASTFDVRGIQLLSSSSDDEARTASSTVSAGDGAFQVTHEALPSSSANAYLVRVTIQNTSDSMAELRYRRTFDWDIAPTQFFEIVSTETGSLPEIAFSSNDGFASPDPLSRRDSRGVTGSFDSFGPKDQGTLLDFDFGGLEPGATRVFTLALGATESEEDTYALIDALGAKAYSVATSAAPDGPAYFVAYGVDDDGTTAFPTAGNDAATVTRGGSADIEVLANDEANVEGGLVITKAAGAEHGTVMCSTTSCRYQHDGGSDTTDSFRYTVRNAAGQTSSGRVDITIEDAEPSAVLALAPVLGPVADLVAGDEVTVTPATYTSPQGALTRTFDWYALYTYGEDIYSYRFASGPETNILLPNWVEGASIQVEETVVAEGFEPVTSKSNVTAAVEGLKYLYVNDQPAFDTTPQVGEPTTVSVIDWQEYVGGDPGEEFIEVAGVDPNFEWYVDGELVRSTDERLSAGGDVFTPDSEDVGAWLYAVISGTKTGYSPGYAYAYSPRIRDVGESFKTVTIELVDPRPDSDPVGDASVTICDENTGSCFWAEQGKGGFRAELPSSAGGIDYQVHVYPYDAGLLTTTEEVTVKNDGPLTFPITLETIKPKPAEVVFPTTQPTRGEGEDQVPMGFIGRPMTFTLDNCAPMATGVVPTWTVEFASGATPMTGTITQVTPGTIEGRSTYEVEIPALTSSGSSTVVTNVDCGEQVVEFTIYIDPSGIVTDQFGRPIPGAEVTLLKQNGPGGAFTPVADGDTDVMDPEVNVTNPSLTDGTGFFRWDVTEGNYQVSLTKARSGGVSCDLFTTPSMSVPPERVDLIIKAQCSGATTPVPTTAPAVTGTRVVGSTLSVSTGAWANGIVQTGIQWLRNGEIIAGQTSPTYALTQDDAGKTITARVTAQRPNYVQENGSGAVVSFAAFDTVATGGGLVPGGGGGGGSTTTTISSTAKPTINGTAKVDGALTANPGTWNTDGLTFAYQWLRDGTPITGATSSGYSPVVGDLGKAISVTVTASKTGLTSGTATSDPVTIGKGAAAENLGKPLVAGDAEVGETLSLSDGTWDLQGLVFSYQWLRDGEPIAGATSATYVVAEADRGTELSARVTAAKAGHDDGTATASGLSVPEVVTPAASTTKATLLGNRVRQDERAEVRVKVTSLGQEAPTGPVTVSVGNRSVEAVLEPGDDGKVVITLPKLKPGTYDVTVVYAGDDLTEPSSAEAGTLTVKQKKGKGKGKGRDKDERTGGGRPALAFV